MSLTATWRDILAVTRGTIDITDVTTANPCADLIGSNLGLSPWVCRVVSSGQSPDPP